ncbi:Mrp/NBP35 family ATP-binding protein [Microbacterium sp. NPDC091382]|uniref:Mrp/NBP35 family ATP-binding protein n=1 Tax=Microbacterium sp. NPDC091382 TaxID=3364210 RepID=UPI0038157699
MSAVVADDVRRAVAAVIDPELRRPLGELDMVRDIVVSDAVARVGIALTIVGCPAADRIEQDVRDAAASVPGVSEVAVDVGVMTPAERSALVERIRGTRRMAFTADSLTRVIAITSGKGGVGKSTLTANLAVALAMRGLAVGLIDADVHGFSIPGLLGLTDDDGRPPQPTRLNDLMLPPVAYGVKTISIGMFLPPEASPAVAWRGPMLHRTVQQFLTDVHFGDLDVLLIDMPPGTGDVAISVGQLLPHAEVVVVTTPQAAAADVAVRSGVVARQTGQSILGVVENMAGFTLPDGTAFDLFGGGGGTAVAAALSSDTETVPLLGSVPLSRALREGGDTGVPVVVGAPDDESSRMISTIAHAIASTRRSWAGRSLPVSRA